MSGVIKASIVSISSEKPKDGSEDASNPEVELATVSDTDTNAKDTKATKRDKLFT